MKRALTLTGAIMGTVANGILSIIMAVGLVAILDVMNGFFAETTILFVALLELAVFILGLIFSIISITRWAKKPSEFKKGSIVVAIVFNFIGAVICLFSETAINLFLGLVLVASAILLIVDLCLERGRVEKAKAKESTPAQAPVQTEE